jgi:putative membrane protein
MHIGLTYGAGPFLRWTRRRAAPIVAASVLVTLLYQVAGWHWLALPWPVLAVLGTAASFIVGFKNTQTYNRSVEAQQVWSAITAGSRYWGLICSDFPTEDSQRAALIHRHLAWLTALRYQLRTPRVWETAGDAPNAEYRHRAFVVPEHAVPLTTALEAYLAPEAIADFVAHGAAPMRLIGQQSAALRALYAAGALAVLHHTEMQKTLKDFIDQHARAERLKNFPYPRQYAIINTLFVRAFALLLPLGMVREFAAAGLVTWLAVPCSVLVAWMYLALDQVGASTENPFEGGANDVPVTHLCAAIEDELRQLLGAEKRGRVSDPAARIVL